MLPDRSPAVNDFRPNPNPDSSPPPDRPIPPPTGPIILGPGASEVLELVRATYLLRDRVVGLTGDGLKDEGIKHAAELLDDVALDLLSLFGQVQLH